MRLWKVVILVNVALAVGLGLGHLRALRETRALRGEIERLRAEASRANPRTWTVRGIVRSSIPQLRVLFLTHEALPGLMEAMTMPFEVADPALLKGLAPGDLVRFTVRQDGERLRVVALEKIERQ